MAMSGPYCIHTQKSGRSVFSHVQQIRGLKQKNNAVAKACKHDACISDHDLCNCMRHWMTQLNSTNDRRCNRGVCGQGRRHTDTRSPVPCAVHTSSHNGSILTGLGGTPFVPRKEAPKPAEKLFSYARAILRRQTSAAGTGEFEVRVADICNSETSFKALGSYFTDETIADLKLLTTEEFWSSVKPEHKLTAMFFIKKFPQYFANSLTTKHCKTAVQPTAQAGEDLHDTRVAFDIKDRMYTVDCSKLFSSSVAPASKPAFEPARETFSRDAVLRLLSTWQLDLIDVKSIRFAMCGLADADIPQLQLFVDSAECDRIDLSFNRFLTFEDATQRDWFLTLLDRMQVVLLGNMRLLMGPKALLRYVASVAPEKLSKIIWLGAGVVCKKRLWRKELGDSVTDAIVNACIDAHVRYFAELGTCINVDSDDDGLEAMSAAVKQVCIASPVKL